MFCKHRVVKPDQDRLADFQGWGSKVAGWAEHDSLGLITQALFKIEGFHFFTFHCNQRRGCLGNARAVGCTQFLAREYGFFNVD